MASKQNKKEELSDFIDSIRKHPEIWDTQNELYKKGDTKQQIWEQLAKEHGYKDIEAAKSKWRYLKDTYIRQKKIPPSGGTPKKPWLYMDAMSFYQCQTEPNPRRCESSSSQAESLADISVLSPEERLKQIIAEDDYKLPAGMKRMKRKFELDKLSDKDEDKENLLGCFRDTAQAIMMAVENPDSGNAECENFGRVVAQKLAKLNSYDQDEAQMRILQIFLDINSRMSSPMNQLGTFNHDDHDESNKHL